MPICPSNHRVVSGECVERAQSLDSTPSGIGVDVGICDDGEELASGCYCAPEFGMRPRGSICSVLGSEQPPEGEDLGSTPPEGGEARASEAAELELAESRARCEEPSKNTEWEEDACYCQAGFHQAFDLDDDGECTQLQDILVYGCTTWDDRTSVCTPPPASE